MWGLASCSTPDARLVVRGARPLRAFRMESRAFGWAWVIDSGMDSKDPADTKDV